MESGQPASEEAGRSDPRRASRFFLALGDPTRLRLIELLCQGERTVGDLVGSLGVPQPKVSRHLKVLRDAGLVRAERDGRNVRCRIASSKGWPIEGKAWIDRLAQGLPLAPESGHISEVTAPARDRESAPAPRIELETHLL